MNRLSVTSSPREASKASLPGKRSSGVFWLIILGIIAGLVIPLTEHLAGKQNGDGILTALISTQKLTWYFWGQDRFLNFIPALAKPFTDIEWNLRVQIFLRAFFAFLSPIGFLYFFNQSTRFLTLAIVLANCLMALVFGQLALFNLYVEHNPFGTSLVLLCLALVTLRRGETSVPWILATLVIGFFAYTTNLALLTISFPLIAVTFCTRTLPRRQLFIFFLINAAAVGLAIWHSKHHGRGTTDLNTLHISHEAIAKGYLVVAAEIWWKSLLVVSVFAILCGMKAKVPHVMSLLLLMAGALALIGVISCALWVQLNSFHIRYYLTAVIALVSCASYFLVASGFRFLQGPREYLGAIIALLAIEFVFGLQGIAPDYAELVDPGWRPHARAIAQAVVSNKVQLVIGDFWYAWPSVFDAIALSSDRDIYGATDRSYVLAGRVRRLDQKVQGIRTLCLYDSVVTCMEKASNGLEISVGSAPGSTAEKITVDGKPMLLLKLTTSPRTLPPLNQSQARSSLAITGTPAFKYDTRSVVIPLEFSDLGPLDFTSNSNYPIHLGVQLLSTTDSVENGNFLRVPIPDIPAGGKASMTIDLPAAGIDGHRMRILPVQEGVAWFDQFGIQGLTVGPFHACKANDQAWMCDVSGNPLPAAR